MAEENTQDVAQQQFAVQKVYLKDVSFETPNSPQAFMTEWKPEINMNVNWNANVIADDVMEVVLVITVTAKDGENTAFLVEVQQAGIFTVNGFSEEEKRPLLGSYCPNILFPFAREAIADIVGKGGFPQLLLAPVNFDALYAQREQEIQAQANKEASH